MANKKKKIMAVAEELFNEYGYDNVSLRTIASEADTTIGNLTYYFKQKEDLLIGILENLHTSFPLTISDELEGLELLENLVEAFLTAQTNESENSFYYRNLYEITKGSDYISKRVKAFQKNLYDSVIKRMQAMQKEGILKSTVSQEEITSFSYTFVSLSTVWLQQNTPYNNELLPKYQISEVLCNLLKLFISPDSISAYLRICKENGIALT